MLLFKQLDLFSDLNAAPVTAAGVVALPTTRSGRDLPLEARARELLRSLGAHNLARVVHVQWSSRLRSAAGRADSRSHVVTLNPRLAEFGEEEIDRTLRHELAHLLAQSRVGRRRIAPHGEPWRAACVALGIAGESRCHTLPFPTQRRVARFLYRCPRCGRDFPRVRRIRRATACLACCRKLNRGRFDRRAQLQLVCGLNDGN